MRLRNRIVAAGLVVALGGACGYATLAPQTARADTAEDLAAAEEQLASLGAELADIQSQLADATESLEATSAEVDTKQAQIEQLEEELAQKRALLGGTMRDNYKSGVSTLLDFILGSQSTEDLVSRVYYLDKASEQQADVIAEVQASEQELVEEREELLAKQQEQEELVASYQEQVADYETRVAEATAYYEELDEQVKAELAAQQQAEEDAAIAAALQAVETSQTAQEKVQAAAAQQTEATTTGSGSTSQGAATNTETGGTGASTTSSSEAPTETSSGTTTTTTTTSSESSAGTSSSTTSSSSLSTSSSTVTFSSWYDYVGYPYVYGGASPSTGFDCSGLVCYIYGWKYGHSSSAMMQGVMASGNWVTSVSELQVGDLVFPYANGGHVGIYVGNGQYLHAANPSRGVVIDTITSFYGGGPY